MAKKLFILLALLLLNNAYADENNNNYTDLILQTYLTQCYKEAEQGNCVSWKDNGLAGFVSVNHMHMEPKEEERDFITLETTIWANRDEFDFPEKTYSKREQELLGPKILKAYVNTCNATHLKTVPIDEMTTCEQPVYYDSYRGWMKCISCVTDYDIAEARDKVLIKMLIEKMKKECEEEEATLVILASHQD